MVSNILEGRSTIFEIILAFSDVIKQLFHTLNCAIVYIKHMKRLAPPNPWRKSMKILQNTQP